MSNSPTRQNHPLRGSLIAEVSAVLAASGLPTSAVTERKSAHGLVITEVGDEAVEVEWFVSRAVRRAAADEQLRALSNDAASLVQETARRHIHMAIFGILSEAGYEVQGATTGVPGTLNVRRGTDGLAGRLARELRSFVAENE